MMCWSQILKPVFGTGTTAFYVSRRSQWYLICAHRLSMGQMVLCVSWLPDLAVCTPGTKPTISIMEIHSPSINSWPCSTPQTCVLPAF